jgi:hypothetical protein
MLGGSIDEMADLHVVNYHIVLTPFEESEYVSTFFSNNSASPVTL